VVIEEVIMSHPHSHFDNAPYNDAPMCIVRGSFPPIKLTTRNFSFTRRHLYVSEKCRNAISSGASEVIQENSVISEARRAIKNS